MVNDVFAKNYENERHQFEIEKYGKRLPIDKLAAHPHEYFRHSIEPAYGRYDRPINESV